jgi:branched-chain amino acid transport system substrate-binding protein
MHRFVRSTLALATMAAACGVAHAQKGETVKIAWIDPLTGLMAPVGQNQIKSFQFIAEHFNKTASANPAGVKFEMVPFDNKLSPQESTNLVKAAADQGIRFITQGNGSGAALAIMDAVAKHNERNPGKEIVYLNYAAVDPDLTNSKCNFWHFRMDADTSMKMEALTTFMKDQTDIKKVYLLNQNYAHGQQVARFAKENLSRKRPDIQIVGEDLHPLAQTRDFAPYVAKIKASGADSVITGNWGSDLALLVKAANDAGLTAKFYTYYTGVTGTPTALGAQSEGRVYQISIFDTHATGEQRKLMDDFKAKFKDDWYTGQTYHVLSALTHAMAKAKTTDPKAVALALEGLSFKSFNGDVQIRSSDHQMQQPLVLSVWKKATDKGAGSYSIENTGFNLAPVRKFDSYVASTPTSCQMTRPK